MDLKNVLVAGLRFQGLAGVAGDGAAFLGRDLVFLETLPIESLPFFQEVESWD